jgi:prophage regulatory protein
MPEQLRASLERRKAVQQRVGLSRSTLYLLISRGEFPPPVRIGARAVAWDTRDVDAWIASKIAAKVAP